MHAKTRNEYKRRRRRKSLILSFCSCIVVIIIIYLDFLFLFLLSTFSFYFFAVRKDLSVSLCVAVFFIFVILLYLIFFVCSFFQFCVFFSVMVLLLLHTLSSSDAFILQSRCFRLDVNKGECEANFCFIATATKEIVWRIWRQESGRRLSRAKRKWKGDGMDIVHIFYARI